MDLCLILGSLMGGLVERYTYLLMLCFNSWPIFQNLGGKGMRGGRWTIGKQGALALSITISGLKSLMDMVWDPAWEAIRRSICEMDRMVW